MSVRPHTVWRLNFVPLNFRHKKAGSGSVGLRSLMISLGLDKAEWLHDIENGDCSLKGFLSIVGDSINEKV